MDDHQQILRQCELKLSRVLEFFNWDEDHILAKNDVVQCAINSDHLVKPDDLAKHEAKCRRRSMGCTDEDWEEQAPSSSFYYEGKKIYSSTLAAQPSITPDHAITFPTPAMRMVAYREFVEEAKRQGYPTTEIIDESLSMDRIKKAKDEAVAGQAPDREKMSEVEFKIAMRDYKRRRQSYRAKNVHITKKSYTEVIREVIEKHVTSVLGSKSSVISLDGQKTDAANSSKRSSNDILTSEHPPTTVESTQNDHKDPRRSRSRSRGRYHRGRYRSRSRDRRSKRYISRSPDSGHRSGSDSPRTSRDAVEDRRSHKKRHDHKTHKHKSKKHKKRSRSKLRSKTP